MPFALVAALMASLGIHAAALFVPDIDLTPAEEPAPLTVEVTLQPRRAPVAPPEAKAVAKAPAAKPAPVRKPATRSGDPVVSAGDTAAASEAAPSVAPPAPPDAKSAAASGTAPDLTSPELPATGTIAYVVMSGDGTTLIGSAEQSWEMADGRYRISSVMETSGLAALIRPVRLETESRGLLTDAGLQPEQYVSRRIGKERVDQVSFDWAAGRARFGNGGEAPLPAGAQDLLSFNYQLGWLAKTGDMAIATGRKLGTYRLELLGKEWLETPAGPIWALHFKASGETTTEVWLASEQHLLPVKIRHIDKKGERFEQVAQEIRLNSR